MWRLLTSIASAKCDEGTVDADAHLGVRRTGRCDGMLGTLALGRCCWSGQGSRTKRMGRVSCSIFGQPSDDTDDPA